MAISRQSIKSPTAAKRARRTAVPAGQVSTRALRSFIVDSNAIYLLPVAVALFYQEYVFAVLFILTCIFSPWYHYRHLVAPKDRVTRLVRNLDWLTSLCIALYAVYYMSVHMVHPASTWFSIASIVLILYFLYGLFHKRVYNKLHPWWHIGTALLGCIIIIL